MNRSRQSILLGPNTWRFSRFYIILAICHIAPWPLERGKRAMEFPDFSHHTSLYIFWERERRKPDLQIWSCDLFFYIFFFIFRKFSFSLISICLFFLELIPQWWPDSFADSGKIRTLGIKNLPHSLGLNPFLLNYSNWVKNEQLKT